MKDLQETVVDHDDRDVSEKIIIDKSHYESIRARLSALEEDRIPSDAFIAPRLYAMSGAVQRDRKWSESRRKKNTTTSNCRCHH